KAVAALTGTAVGTGEFRVEDKTGLGKKLGKDVADKLPAALEAGSREAYSAIARFQSPREAVEDKQLRVQERQEQHLWQIARDVQIAARNAAQLPLIVAKF